MNNSAGSRPDYTTIGGAPAGVRCERHADGSIIISNNLPLPEIHGTIPGRLKHWAAATPEAIFLSQDDRLLTYGQAETLRRRLAQRLLNLPISLDRPLAIVADNGIDHALVMLAATSVGLPVAIISTSYLATGARPWEKFNRIIDQVAPSLIVADQPDAVKAALAESSLPPIDVQPLTDLSWLHVIDGVPASVADAAEQTVGLDTVAKLLLTSGSTGEPKAVPNTQRMMVSNMLGLATVWPFLAERRPVSVDWLPWNHTFGGNCCFNITLWFGGHSHIDGGRPTPALFDRSIAALRRWPPSLYYNVPAGFEMLLHVLEADAAFARDFLHRLDFIFNGGAPLPPVLRERLDAVARSVGAAPHIVAGWGSTETAPFSSVLYFDQPHANNLGVPIPGTAVKMVPADGRYELRVKGPNVMPGYWRDEAASAAAFDEEGFYRIGDAGKFAEPGNPAAGIVFDGRTAENFKLASGTWVNVGALRLAVISATEKLITDVVVTGEGRNDLGLLIFVNEQSCRAFLGPEACAGPGDQSAGNHPAIRQRISELLDAYNRAQIGSSTRICRFAILTEPPSSAQGEITDKGYLNQRRILSRRSEDVERLYQSGS